MLKNTLGFGGGAVNVNGSHLNANFNGYDQSFPYTPVFYDVPAPTGGFQPAWAVNRNFVISMGGSAR